MNEGTLFTILGAILLYVAPAAAGGADDDMLSRSPALTPQEKAGVSIAKSWDDASAMEVMPSAGPNGEITFVYGAQRPSVVCSPINICVIALQRGERHNSVHLGDTVRWEMEPAITGSGSEDQVVHILIKPKDVGLETNLVVATDRRIYNIRLRSHATDHMPLVTFSYPEDTLAKFDALRVVQAREREERTIPETGAYLGDLSFDYSVEGTARWKPIRIYNDGKKTVIQMPNAVSQTKLPTLYLLEREAGLFTDEKLEIVNARFQGNQFIVDAVFDKAILLLGTGDDRERVTITRGQGG